MTISVCVGTACHLKGSQQLIDLLKAELKKAKLEEKVNLEAAFCLGKCGNGISVQFGETIVNDVSPENFQKMFKEYVLDKVL